MLDWRVVRVLCIVLVLPCVGWGQAGSNWDRVKQLNPGTAVRVGSFSGPRIACEVVRVDDAELVCERTRTIFLFAITRQLTFRRERVREVRLTKAVLSSLAGAGIGAGVGVGVGYGLQNKATRAEDPGLLPVGFGVLGATVGGLVGRATDLLGGPTIYRAP